jgi:hypothetical protein
MKNDINYDFNPFKNPIKKSGRLNAPVQNTTDVKCRLMFKTETRQAWITISVRSNRRPMIWNHRHVSADSSRLEYEIARNAEDLAIYQAMVYQDIHNPQAVARAAIEALYEIMSEASRASKKIISVPSGK